MKFNLLIQPKIIKINSLDQLNLVDFIPLLFSFYVFSFKISFLGCKPI
jgi:hypothetical protein